MIVALGFVVASRPRVSSNVVVGLLVAGALLVIGIGVAGGVAGTREFHEHEDEHEEEGALGAVHTPVVIEVAR
jgi:hypothetical protein